MRNYTENSPLSKIGCLHCNFNTLYPAQPVWAKNGCLWSWMQRHRHLFQLCLVLMWTASQQTVMTTCHQLKSLRNQRECGCSSPAHPLAHSEWAKLWHQMLHAWQCWCNHNGDCTLRPPTRHLGQRPIWYPTTWPRRVSFIEPVKCRTATLLPHSCVTMQQSSSPHAT